MSTENPDTEKDKTQLPKVKFAVITDAALIEEFNKQELYIPPNETPATYDNEMMGRKAYSVSADEVGQLRPIEVAIWKDDPNKNSPTSMERIHMRIINGRHRYFDDPNWRREYYDLSGKQDPIWAYFEARQHFDLQKKSQPAERAILIEQMAEHLIKHEGLAPDQCCNEIVKRLVPQGVASEVTIRNHCDKKYKNKDMSAKKEGKTFELAGKETQVVKQAKKIVGKKVIELEGRVNTLVIENTELQKKNSTLEENIRSNMNVIQDLESKLRIVSALDKTTEIDGIKIRARVDATSNKIIVEKSQ